MRKCARKRSQAESIAVESGIEHPAHCSLTFYERAVLKAGDNKVEHRRSHGLEARCMLCY